MQVGGEIIRIGMAQSATAKAPAVLMTSGLGSCIGVTFYDPLAHVGGMCHVMLPDSGQAKSADNKAKFADSAIPEILEWLRQIGARKERLIVKMAGGAQMFSFGNSGEDRFSIGKRNAEAVRAALHKEGLRLTREDTGGNRGRTMIFDTSDGTVILRTIEAGETKL